MFLLRVTSGPEVIGIESDDGFTIGHFTSDTLFLVIGMTVGSTLVVGPAYAVIRRWLPPRWRVPVLSVFLAVFGGAVLFHTDGIDFTLLSPRWLSIVLFIAIPATFGAALEPLRSLVSRATTTLPRAALTPFPALLAVPSS